MDPTLIQPPSSEARARFRRPLAAREKLALASEIVTTYARARWLLRSREIGETIVALRRGASPAEGPDGDQLLTGLRLGRVVGRTLGALPADSRCLVRSLVLTSLLARRGIPSLLVIGVRSEPTFEAHAWVESGGVPLLPPGDEAYGRLVEF